MQVIGNDAAVGFAGAQGNFELNVFKPVIIHNFLRVDRGCSPTRCRAFDEHCAVGIEPNRDAHRRAPATRSLMLVTALNPHIGYDNAAADRQEGAPATGTTLREAALASGCVTAEEFDRWVDPRR